MKKKLKSPADISRELVVLPSESEGKGGRWSLKQSRMSDDDFSVDLKVVTSKWTARF